MSGSEKKSGPTVSKNGVLQVKPADIFRSSKAMDQMRKTSEAVKRVNGKDRNPKK